MFHEDFSSIDGTIKLSIEHSIPCDSRINLNYISCDINFSVLLFLLSPLPLFLFLFSLPLFSLFSHALLNSFVFQDSEVCRRVADVFE